MLNQACSSGSIFNIDPKARLRPPSRFKLTQASFPLYFGHTGFRGSLIAERYERNRGTGTCSPSPLPLMCPYLDRNTPWSVRCEVIRARAYLQKGVTATFFYDPAL